MKRSLSRVRAAVLVLALAAGASALAAGCGNQERNQPTPSQMSQGNPERGSMLIVEYGCGTCHTVPGVDGADALVGPPLTHWVHRRYVAGMLVNTPKNVEHWIEDPQEVVPGNDMPDLGVSHRDATDITAYLYTLQ